MDRAEMRAFFLKTKQTYLQTQEDSMLEQIDREETEKRPGRGKKSAAEGSPVSKKTNTIPLSAERLAKL